MSAEIRLFPCLKDNFGVLLHDPETGATAAIDAPEAAAVEEALAESGWRLTDILVTHHHGDHTGGILELKQRHACRVIAPRNEASGIPGVDATAGEGDTVTVGHLTGRVIDTPGHTRGHISYHFEGARAVFVGDTLFSVGCGRLLEGDAAMMWNSLLKLRRLPDETRIYCGHEYTAANIRFALSIDPNNPALRARAEDVAKLTAAGRPTIPTTIGEERSFNPFLRADDRKLAGGIGMGGSPPASVFGEIRKRKDNF